MEWALFVSSVGERLKQYTNYSICYSINQIIVCISSNFKIPHTMTDTTYPRTFSLLLIVPQK